MRLECAKQEERQLSPIHEVWTRRVPRWPMDDMELTSQQARTPYVDVSCLWRAPACRQRFGVQSSTTHENMKLSRTQVRLNAHTRHGLWSWAAFRLDNVEGFRVFWSNTRGARVFVFDDDRSTLGLRDADKLARPFHANSPLLCDWWSSRCEPCRHSTG